jgi:hypothetical protein
MFPGFATGIWLVVRWLRRRRIQFVALAKEGCVVPAYDIAATWSAAVIGSSGGMFVARAALGSVGSVVAQAYGGPIVAAVGFRTRSNGVRTISIERGAGFRRIPRIPDPE